VDPIHLRVADGRRHDSQEPTRAATLDAEVFPRLEHPGWWLGPFGASGVGPARATRAVLVWPEAPQGGFLPPAVEPFHRKLRDAGHSLEFAYVPTSDLRQGLAAAGLGPVCSGSWTPLDAHDVWVVWMEDPLQVLGLIALLRAAGLPPRAADRGPDHPSLLVTGPATRAAHVLRAFADRVVPRSGELLEWLGDLGHAPRSEAPFLDTWLPPRPVDAPAARRARRAPAR